MHIDPASQFVILKLEVQKLKKEVVQRCIALEELLNQQIVQLSPGLSQMPRKPKIKTLDIYSLYPYVVGNLQPLAFDTVYLHYNDNFSILNYSPDAMGPEDDPKKVISYQNHGSIILPTHEFCYRFTVEIVEE